MCLSGSGTSEIAGENGFYLSVKSRQTLPHPEQLIAPGVEPNYIHLNEKAFLSPPPTPTCLMFFAYVH